MFEHEMRVCPSRKRTLTIGDITFSSFFDFEVSQKDLRKARRELNEKEESREDCIRNLRNRLQKDTKFRYRTDDCYLLAFLRIRKFDIDKAYNTIRKGHSVRVDYPEMFAVPQNLEQLCNTDFFCWLPYRDQEGRIILTANFGKWHLSEMSFHEALQLTSALFEIICSNAHCQVNGVVGIWDCKGFTMSHITCGMLSPRMLWPISIFMQECFPNRIKLLLFINCPTLFHAAYHTMKFLLKKKIMDRIKMLGSDLSELHQYVNPVLLPKELGGTLKNEECSSTQHVMDNVSYLKYIQSLTTASDSLLPAAPTFSCEDT